MYFTNGATRSFETMMIAVPNFDIREKGRVILNRFHYTPQTVECALCTEYRQKKCGLNRCPYLKEKIEAGDVSYKTLADDCFADNKHIAFDRRLPEVYDRRKPSLYADPEHQRRFALAKSYKDMRICNTPPHVFAALFLLTSSFHLWSRCEMAVTKLGISFENVNLRGIDMNDYIVFQAAKTIYTGKESNKSGRLVYENREKAR